MSEEIKKSLEKKMVKKVVEKAFWDAITQTNTEEIKYHTLRLLVLPFSHKEVKKLDYLEAVNELKKVG